MLAVPAGYMIKKVYVIICDQCAEDITRPQGGDEPETREAALEMIREHQKIWHPSKGRRS